MKEETGKPNIVRELIGSCKKREITLLLSAAVILLHLALRGNRQLMCVLSEKAVRPVHRFLSRVTAGVPFSVAEVLILSLGIFVLLYIGISLILLFRRGEKGRRLYRILITLLMTVSCIYAGFCVLWGIYYYGEDFQTQSGLETREISTEELETVTVYFAALANSYADQVERDDRGVCVSDRSRILEESPEVYAKAEEIFPSLSGDAIPAKRFFFSKLLSLTDFTGFFFPFTAEANVNTDSPQAFFAATVAHELAHQRGVAKEQEANFTAVFASLLYGDPDYCYSACLLAYTHLSNALYSADRDAWQHIYTGLDDRIKADYAEDRAYWQRFQTPAQTVSNAVYENFLYSYDQDLGLKSYGACVDLLVCWYLEEAQAFFSIS